MHRVVLASPELRQAPLGSANPTPGGYSITLTSAKNGLDIGVHLNIYPEGSFIWTKDIPHDKGVELIKLTLKNYSPLTEEQIVGALCVGAIVYEFIPNITATYLLTIQLPIVDPENTQFYLQEGEKAFQALQLRHYWYTYVEYRSKKDFETLAFYRKMLNEFRRRM